MIDPWIFAFSFVTVAATIFVGFWSARRSRSASDFFVAGRSVSVGWNASAISGEYLSAASFMGVAGMVMSSGYDALWYPVCYACGYLFLLLFIAGPLRRFGAYTIPDFAEGRYDSPVFRKIAVVFVLFIGFFYTMPQMKGAGTTLAYVFKDITWFGQKGLPYWVGVVVVGAVITLNVALGGMKGITLVQAFQYWLKMFAISVPIFVLASVYGGYGRQLGINGAASPATAAISQTNGSSPQRASTTAKGEMPVLLEPADGSAQPEYLDLSKSSFRLLPVLSVDRTQFGELLSGDKLLTDRLFDLKRQVGLANAQSRSLTIPHVDVAGALATLSYQMERTVYFHTNLNPLLKTDLGTVIVFDSTSKRAVSALVTILGRRGLSVVEDKAGTLFAMPSDLVRSPLVGLPAAPVESMQRPSLPAKAPKDETWLNPFGPLTTKPAKAANLSPEAARPYALLYTYSLIIALVCGTAGLPHILVRFYTNPDGVAAKRTTMWVMILIGVFYVFPPVFGVMGRNLMPALYEGTGVNGTDGIVLKLPTVLHERFGALGSVLSGLACAGAFAAFMSTFSGLLVSMTGALAHDVYGRILRPQSTPGERMKMFKFCAVIIGTVAVLLGTLVENFEINFMVGQAFAIAAASYFPLLFMSVWWRGMTTRGAATGMLTGGLLAVLAISLTSWTTFLTAQATKFKALGGAEPGWFAGLKPYSLSGFWAEHPLLRILGEQPAIWAVPLAITLMIVVSKLTRVSVPADIRDKMLVLHAPEALGLRQDYIRDHEAAH